MARRAIWDNLLKNGDFSSYPVGVIPTTAATAWIDNTNAGSLVNDSYGWAIAKSGAGTASALLNAGTLKLAITVANATVDARRVQSTITNEKLRKNAVWVQPSTSYTITFRMKTNYVSGDSTGARMAIVQYDGANAALTTTNSTAVKTTTDWTDYSVVITTQATCNFIDPRPTLIGVTAPSTLLMDVEFDDIVIRTTTPIVRQAV